MRQVPSSTDIKVWQTVKRNPCFCKKERLAKD
jgi:hypothetical protein